MLAKLNTFALVGIDAVPVVAEVDVAVGLPKTVLVGLPEMAVRESIHRIERALVNLDYDRHPGRTIINLAPADLKKDACGFDLPIALALLVATGQLKPEQLADFAMAGELALDGSVRPIRGALSMAMNAAARGIPKLLVPAASAREAAVVKSVQVYGVSSCKGRGESPFLPRKHLTRREIGVLLLEWLGRSDRTGCLDRQGRAP
jgi:magnesium chelatase family protein